jgi:hypothetical protein
MKKLIAEMMMMISQCSKDGLSATEVFGAVSVVYKNVETIYVLTEFEGAPFLPKAGKPKKTTNKPSTP